MDLDLGGAAAPSPVAASHSAASSGTVDMSLFPAAAAATAVSSEPSQHQQVLLIRAGYDLEHSNTLNIAFSYLFI